MSSSTTTVTVSSADPVELQTSTMLKEAEVNHTKPLWLQMSRLNPAAPNPRCTPYVWEYEKLRPSLLKAGELVTEHQAERRVLMLVNPSRGMYIRERLNFVSRETEQKRCALHHRYHVCRSAAGDAERDGQGTSSYRLDFCFAQLLPTVSARS